MNYDLILHLQNKHLSLKDKIDNLLLSFPINEIHKHCSEIIYMINRYYTITELKTVIEKLNLDITNMDNSKYRFLILNARNNETREYLLWLNPNIIYYLQHTTSKNYVNYIIFCVKDEKLKNKLQLMII